MHDQLRNAHGALGVITRTRHIIAYLAANDPQALFQAEASFQALDALIQQEDAQ